MSTDQLFSLSHPTLKPPHPDSWRPTDFSPLSITYPTSRHFHIQKQPRVPPGHCNPCCCRGLFPETRPLGTTRRHGGGWVWAGVCADVVYTAPPAESGASSYAAEVPSAAARRVGQRVVASIPFHSCLLGCLPLRFAVRLGSLRVYSELKWDF